MNISKFQGNPLKLYLNCIRNTLEAAMCLQVATRKCVLILTVIMYILFARVYKLCKFLDF